MEIIPIEYCDVSDAYIHLNQCQSDCAFEHCCESAEPAGCPLKRFFSKPVTIRTEAQAEQNDMPDFYFAVL